MQTSTAEGERARQLPLLEAGQELRDQDENGYVITEFLGRGGTGEVYRLQSPLHGNGRVAKVFVPFYYLDQVARMGLAGTADGTMTQQVFEHFEGLRISDGEYKTLATVQHPFIVSVHDHINISLGEHALKRLKSQFGLDRRPMTVYAIIADFVDGVSFERFVKATNSANTYSAIRSIAQALDYLNLDRRLLHCDIKSDNVLVRPSDSLPVIVDFGLAQQGESVEDRLIAVATELLPDDAGIPEIGQLRGKLLRNEMVSRVEFMNVFYPWLDRYQFGLLLRQVSSWAIQLADAERSYLRLLSDRFTDVGWLRDNRDLRISDLVDRVDANRVYPVVRTGARTDDYQIPAPGRSITVPASLKALALHPALVRLNRQNQLGLLPARFPGAQHSRYLHSLDCYRLARSFARILLDRPDFRFLMSEADVQRLLLGALYHDVNHLPFLHVFQEVQDRSFLPDALTVALQYRSTEGPPLDDLLVSVGLTVEDLRELVKPHGAASRADPANSIIRSVLDSGCDVDKLSYLQLDSYNSGLNFAAQIDVGGLFRFAQLGVTSGAVDGFEQGCVVVCYDEAGVDLLESVARARVQAFEQLYWTPANRAMMACFTSIVEEIADKPGGPPKLTRLVEQSPGVSDYSFLVSLDDLAKASRLERPKLAEFFDTGGIGLDTLASFESASLVRYVRGLAGADRVKYLKTVRDHIADRLSCTSASVLVDVPGRMMDLGGPLFVRRADGTAVDVGDQENFERYRRRLAKLSDRISVFSPAASSISSAAETTQVARAAFDRAKDKSTWS